MLIVAERDHPTGVHVYRRRGGEFQEDGTLK